MTKRNCHVTDVGDAIEKLADALDPKRTKPFPGDILDLLEWATKDVLELKALFAKDVFEMKALFAELDRVATHNYATKDAENAQLRQQLEQEHQIVEYVRHDPNVIAMGIQLSELRQQVTLLRDALEETTSLLDSMNEGHPSEIVKDARKALATTKEN